MLVEGLKRLVNDVEPYMGVLRIGEEVRLAVELTDIESESATLVVGDTMRVLDVIAEPDARVFMTSDSFRGVLNGDKDFGALIGRTRMSESRPIDFEVISTELAGETMELLKGLMTHFFLPGKVKSKRLSGELAGEAHGAHPIPLVYWDGLRVAWYKVDAGEVLNEKGERDPYPQLLINLSGRGRLLLDEGEVNLEENRAYYIPPDGLHQVRAEETVKLIWIAWSTPHNKPRTERSYHQ
ncbi:MAG: cupin domain-containing protein [Candidatus Bathyarchaeia archaeon]